MKLQLSEAQAVFEKEIQWCLDHPDQQLSQEHQIGFVNGLRQAQYLLRKAERALLETSIIQDEYLIGLMYPYPQEQTHELQG
jgi:hypothetical protein